MNRTIYTTFAFAFALISAPAISSAALLDWDTVDWSQGSETQTFYNVDGTGVDVTIALSLSYDWDRYGNYRDSYYTQTDWINDAPNDNKTFGGDGSTQSDESLYLGLNFASDDRYQSYLDVTITFSEAVDSAGFQLFDVDAYGTNYWGGYETGIQFVDIIERVEGSLDGVSVAGTVTHDNYKILEGTNETGTYYQGNTSLSDVNDQNDNPRSTLNLAWNSPVDTLSFRYTTGSGAVADPGNQAIGLSSIGFCNYNAVPEPTTVISAILIPLVGFFTYQRRRKAKATA